MREPAYPAARAVARRVEAYFSRHIDAALARGETGVAPKPGAEILEALIDVAFWASLRREEGYPPRISMAFLPPADGLRFERPLPLAADVLTRLAPAVERPGIHLGVWPLDEDLAIWGATRQIPAFCLVLEVVTPGVVVIKYRRRDDSRKFVNVAALEGDRIKVIHEDGARAPECPALVASLLGFESSILQAEPANVLVELALSIRRHHRGGTLLIVQRDSDAWLESMVQPMAYAVAPPFRGLAELVRQDSAGRGEPQWGDVFNRLIDGIAGLTAVDGATVLNNEYEVLGFGAKIVPRNGAGLVKQVLLTEPIENVKPRIVDVGRLGGTRHLSAAQFVQDQRDAIALVASQDDRFTVLAWSPSAGIVHAHSVEALLL